MSNTQKHLYPLHCCYCQGPITMQDLDNKKIGGHSTGLVLWHRACKKSPVPKPMRLTKPQKQELLRIGFGLECGFFNISMHRGTAVVRRSLIKLGILYARKDDLTELGWKLYTVGKLLKSQGL